MDTDKNEIGKKPLLVIFANGNLAYDLKGKELLDYLKNTLQSKREEGGNPQFKHFPVEIWEISNKKRLNKKQLKEMVAELEDNLNHAHLYGYLSDFKSAGTLANVKVQGKKRV